MRILITGGCGFIGSNLTDFHLRKGDEVHIVDDLSTGTLQNISAFQNNPGFHFDHSDLLTWPGLNDAVNWAERIYHLAAVVGIFRVLKEPLKLMQTNVSSCERLLQAVSVSASRPHTIIASSSSVYGPTIKSVSNENDNLIVESIDHPLRLYAISKIADEALAIAYHQTFQMPLTVLRLFNVIGPRQTGMYGMVVPRFVKQACLNEPMTIFGDGNQTRSFCDIRDVMLELDFLIRKTETNCEIVNIGNDHEITINELAELIRKRANSKSEIKHISYREAYGLEFIDFAKRRPDINKLSRLSGFTPQWTLEQTIDDLIALYVKTGRV